jgi:hypothetical protein
MEIYVGQSRRICTDHGGGGGTSPYHPLLTTTKWGGGEVKPKHRRHGVVHDQDEGVTRVLLG